MDGTEENDESAMRAESKSAAVATTTSCPVARFLVEASIGE
jgi:hypothetical protein